MAEIRITNVIENIVGQIEKQFSPESIYLFGSQAKGTARKHSDIDLCVIAETDSKRELIADLYFNIDSEIPFDIVLYTPEEWEECKMDTSSFAHKIGIEEVRLY